MVYIRPIIATRMTATTTTKYPTEDKEAVLRSVSIEVMFDTYDESEHVVYTAVFASLTVTGKSSSEVVVL